MLVLFFLSFEFGRVSLVPILMKLCFVDKNKKWRGPTISITNCNWVCVFCGAIFKVWVFFACKRAFSLPVLLVFMWGCDFCWCVDVVYTCSSTVQVQDETLDFGAMLRKIVLSPTRRVLVVSLTMYSCLCSSRFLSGPHIVLLVSNLFDWLYIGEFITFEQWSMLSISHKFLLVFINFRCFENGSS